MSETKRPISVLIVAALYLAVGTVGFIAHFPRQTAIHGDDVVVEITELVAFTAGMFLLRGQNWARWLALSWILFHVGISYFDGIRPVLIHSLLCALIAWALFHAAANRYFGHAPR